MLSTSRLPDPIIPLSSLRRLHRSPLRRQPARRRSSTAAASPTPTMQAIAKEMNFSETTFVLPPERPGTDVRVRIFTPGDELPMAGHPTIGSAFALARAGVLGAGPRARRLRARRRADAGGADLARRRPELRLDAAAAADLRRAAGRARARRGSRSACPRRRSRAPALPVQVVSCGVPYLLVPLATRRAVDNASLNRAAADDRCPARSEGDDLAVFLFSHRAGGDKATVYSRMFAPDSRRRRGSGHRQRRRAARLLPRPAQGRAAGESRVRC